MMNLLTRGNLSPIIKIEKGVPRDRYTFFVTVWSVLRSWSTCDRMECTRCLGHLRPFEVYGGVGTLSATIWRVWRDWDTACDHLACTRCPSTVGKQPDGSVAAVPATTEPLVYITRVIHIS